MPAVQPCRLDGLKIDGFRGLRNLELEQLGRFNLLVGENNSGKTSVLEALAILSDPLSLWWWNRVAYSRDYSRFTQSPVENLTWLFQHTQASVEAAAEMKMDIQVSGICPVVSLHAVAKGETKPYEGDEEDADVEKHSRLARVESASGDVAGIRIGLKVEFSTDQLNLFEGETDPFLSTTLWEPDALRKLTSERRATREKKPVFNTMFSPPYYHRATRVITSRLSRSIRKGLKNELLDLLHLFDPDILDFITEMSGSIRPMPTTYLEYRDLGYMPLQTFGDGVQCVINLTNQLFYAENGLLLIDELETALHASVLPEVIKWLKHAAVEYNVQIIATTHSLEVVDALLAEETESQVDEVVVYRLGSKEGQSTSKRLDSKMLWSLRGEMGLEVR